MNGLERPRPVSFLPSCYISTMSPTSRAPLHVLGIETSGPEGGVALIRENRVAIEETLARGLLHGRNLIPALQAIFERTGLDPAALDLIAVTRGPGSHTGIRVGLMAAMTLAHALNTPVLGVDALLALCRQAPTGTSATVAAIDARRDRIFAGIRSGDGWRVEPALRPAADLARLVPDGAGLIGSGVPSLLAHLHDRAGCVPAPEVDWRIRAATVARIGAEHPEQAGRPEEVRAVYFH